MHYITIIYGRLLYAIGEIWDSNSYKAAINCNGVAITSYMPIETRALVVEFDQKHI